MDDAHGPLIARSTVLVAAGALLAGCTNRRRGTSASPTGPATASAAPTGPVTTAPGTSADPALSSILQAAILRERNLIAVYDFAIARLPGLARTLRRLQAHHGAHADRLAKAVPPERSSPSESPPAGTGPVSSPPPARRGPGVTAVLRGLVDAELAAARAGVAAAGGAPGSAAVLLAEIAGSEAQHAVVLQRLPAGGRA